MQLVIANNYLIVCIHISYTRLLSDIIASHVCVKFGVQQCSKRQQQLRGNVCIDPEGDQGRISNQMSIDEEKAGSAGVQYNSKCNICTHFTSCLAP